MNAELIEQEVKRLHSNGRIQGSLEVLNIVKKKTYDIWYYDEDDIFGDMPGFDITHIDGMTFELTMFWD
ncbi:hypothetical protein V1503_24170 [Bacillus sp. SCS-151]|uniref:hypothetical protein n=1 Tax=Nanhaiella sioensis TaxID=3115293 RepID=UPI00397B652C